MTAPDAIPEEDLMLCKHQWVDLYNGSGVTRHNPDIALQAFYCKFCLQIRVKSWNQARYRLSEDGEAEREKFEGGDEATA